MAFDISLDMHGTGMPARYWRITQAHLDHLRGTATVWLHGWKDPDTRHAGHAPAGSLTLHLDAADLPTDMHAADTAALYAGLKNRAAAATDPAFTRAVPGTEAAVLRDAGDC